MPRLARIVIADAPHHVTQRGNNRQDVFFVDDGRRFYLDTLEGQCRRFGVEIVGYCLMSNHVHLLLVPHRAESLALAVGRTHFRYTQYVNALHGRSGHLWQGRFFSCALDDRHVWTALRYIEQNPVRARLVRAPWRYAWSSARAHAEGRDRAGRVSLEWFAERMSPLEWRAALGERAESRELDMLRRRLARGWPLASDRWLAKMEKVVGRRLRPLPVGWQKGRRRGRSVR